jgi:hypothetical protein
MSSCVQSMEGTFKLRAFLLVHFSALLEIITSLYHFV